MRSIRPRMPSRSSRLKMLTGVRQGVTSSLKLEPVLPGASDARIRAARSGSASSATESDSRAEVQPSGREPSISCHWSANRTAASVGDGNHCSLLACRRVATLEGKGQVSSSGRLKEFLREMLLIRRFEEKVEERFRAGELPGFLHVAIGQEAVAVGVCQALEENDVIASTHRAHGHTLAKGTHPNEVMAELYGKVEGMSHGYGGSMHLYDVERGNLGANAVVGGALAGIVGAARANQIRVQ